MSALAESEILDDEINEVLTKEQAEDIIAEQQYQLAIRNLIVWSFLLFTIPLSLVYCSYRFIFKDHYKMSEADASLYGGLIGVFAVYILIMSFVFVAHHEEKEMHAKIKQLKSQ